jgi:hypothetical protein
MRKWPPDKKGNQADRKDREPQGRMKRSYEECAPQAATMRCRPNCLTHDDQCGNKSRAEHKVEFLTRIERSVSSAAHLTPNAQKLSHAVQRHN